MALSWLQKRILKSRPKAIEKSRFIKVNDESMAYALEHGYQIDPNRLYYRDFFTLPSYVKKCLEIGSPEVFSALSDSYNFSIMPNSLKDVVLQRYIESDLPLTGYFSMAEEFSTNPTLWLRTVKQNPEMICNLRPIKELNIPELEKGKFMSEFMELKIPYQNLSHYDRDTEEILRMYFDADPINTYENFGSYVSEKDKYLAKEQFLSSLDRNLGNISALRRFLESGYIKVQFTPKEKERIIEAAIKQNYILKAGDYGFLKENPTLMYSTIMSMQDKFDPELKNSLEEATKNPISFLDREQKIALGHQLVRLNYNFDLSNSRFDTNFYDGYVLEGLTSENPFYINQFNFIWDNTARLQEILTTGQYVITRDTPRSIMNGFDVEYILQNLERNFDEVVKTFQSSAFMYNVEQKQEIHRRIYEICKENGYIIDDNSPIDFRRNPYLLRDAIRAGRIQNIPESLKIVELLPEVSNEIRNYVLNNPEVNISELDWNVQNILFNSGRLAPQNTKEKDELLTRYSDYELKNNKEFVLESARKYFPSIRNTRLSVEDFTPEEQKEISEMFFKYMENSPNERESMFESEIRCLEYNPYIILEQARRGDFSFSFFALDYFTEEQKRELEELEKIAEQEKVEANPNRRLSPRIRKILQMINYWGIDNYDEFKQNLEEEGIVPTLEKDDPEDLKAHHWVVMAALEKDFSNIENVSPILALSDKERKWLAQKAIENNYDVNQNSLYILRQSPELAVFAAKNKLEQLQYFSRKIKFNEDQQKELVDALISNENKIILGDDSFEFLRGNEAYVRFSVQNSTPENVQSLIDNIDFYKISKEYRAELFDFIFEKIQSGEYVFNENSHTDLLYDERILNVVLENNILSLTQLQGHCEAMPLDWQEKIYNAYQAQKEQGTVSESLAEIMSKNTYYMQDYIMQNLDKIDDIDCKGIYFTDEFKETLIAHLLQSGYEVTDKTPRFLIGNIDFMSNYVLQDISRLSRVNIRGFFTPENIKNNENIKKVMSLLPEDFQTPVDMYLNAWGRENAIELLGKYGSSVKYLNKNINYSIEEAAEEFLGLFRRGGIQNVDDIINIITGLNVELTEEDFKNLGVLETNSRLFEELIDQNPNYVRFYKGIQDGVYQKAIDNGLFEGKTDKEIEELLNENVSQSTAVMNYLLENNSKDWIGKYTGGADVVFEKAIEVGSFSDLSDEQIKEFLSNKNFSDNPVFIEYLMEQYSPKYIEQYTGTDARVFFKALENGAFELLSDEQINLFLLTSPIACGSKEIMQHLIEKRNASYIEQYSGVDEEVYKKALESGYEPDVEKLLIHMNLLKSNVMFDVVTSKNPEAYALRFPKMKKEEIAETLDKIYADKEFLTDERRNVFASVASSLSANPKFGLDVLRAFNPELVEKIGVNNWRTLIRYSIKHPKLNELVQISEEHKLDDFLKVYKNISPLIRDEFALGINKFLNIASFYAFQPDFCQDLVKALEEGRQLSDSEQINLRTLIYNSENYKFQQIEFDNLSNLLQEEKERFSERLETKDKKHIKSDLIQYLFNLDEYSAKSLFSYDINSKVIAHILDNAKKDKNQQLQLEAEYMSVLIDTLEKVYYFDGDEAELREFAKKIYSTDEKDILKIRKEFVNIKETVRQFYEKDAMEELTDIKTLAQNPEYYTYHQFKEPDGTDSQIKVVDISNMKHTVYGHHLGTSVSDIFDRDEGRATICVSPETDIHEVFYGGESDVILIFSEIPKGSFIGSATSNMGSNGSIDYNDFRVDGVATSLRQKGIRESYENEGHAETLLYRAGLIPTGIKMVGDTPTVEEINAARELEQKILEMTGEKVEIPIIKTQHQGHRVVKYQGNITNEKELADYTERASQIQSLRRDFMDIVDIAEPEVAIRKDYEGQKYTIIDGEVYSVLEANEQNYSMATTKVGGALERLIYGPDSTSIIQIREFEENDTQYFATRRANERNFWRYNREDGHFSPEVNSIMLKEFLVDHLMCNYRPNNESFLIGTDNTVYPIKKDGAFASYDDFVNRDGKPYTSMSYLYFDGKSGNNLYRRVFEDYITNPDESSILSNAELSDFVRKAQEISAMENDEYLKIFKPILDTRDTEEDKEKFTKMILARKENAGKDAEEFVARLKEARQIEQKPDVIQNPQSIAFINDIHGNLAAVESLIEECKRTGKKTIYVLGDMIGFGPQSNECLDALRQASSDIEIKCILGNHEMYSLMGNENFTETPGFDSNLTSQIRGELSPENRAFLEGLPISRRLLIKGKKVELTHFPVRRTYKKDQDIYVEHGNVIAESSSGVGQNYLIYGHEHRTESTTGNEVGTILETEKNGVMYINLPSSGCVHGKNTSYVSLELEDGKLQAKVNVVSYDQEKTKEAIRVTNNPKGYFFGAGGQDGR